MIASVGAASAKPARPLQSTFSGNSSSQVPSQPLDVTMTSMRAAGLRSLYDALAVSVRAASTLQGPRSKVKQPGVPTTAGQSAGAAQAHKTPAHPEGMEQMSAQTAIGEVEELDGDDVVLGISSMQVTGARKGKVETVTAVGAKSVSGRTRSHSPRRRSAVKGVSSPTTPRGTEGPLQAAQKSPQGSPRSPPKVEKVAWAQPAYDGDHFSSLTYDFASRIVMYAVSAREDEHGHRAAVAHGLDVSLPISARMARHLNPVAVAAQVTAVIRSDIDVHKLYLIRPGDASRLALPLPKCGPEAVLLLTTALVCVRRGAYAVIELQQLTLGNARFAFLQPRDACFATFLACVRLGAGLDTMQATQVLTGAWFDARIVYPDPRTPIGPRLVYTPALEAAAAFFSAQAEAPSFHLHPPSSSPISSSSTENVPLGTPATVAVLMSRLRDAVHSCQVAWPGPEIRSSVLPPPKTAMQVAWVVKHIGGLLIPVLVDPEAQVPMETPLTRAAALDPSWLITKMLDAYGPSLSPILQAIDVLAPDGLVVPLPSHPAEAVALIVTAMVAAVGGTGALADMSAADDLRGRYPFLNFQDAAYPALVACVEAAAGTHGKTVMHKAWKPDYPAVAASIYARQ